MQKVQITKYGNKLKIELKRCRIRINPNAYPDCIYILYFIITDVIAVRIRIANGLELYVLLLKFFSHT